MSRHELALYDQLKKEIVDELTMIIVTELTAMEDRLLEALGK